MPERWTYHRDHSRRPHVHPLRTPAGVTLTRDAPADHPWHHGLWFTIKYVNGENFWEEVDAYGVLRHVDDKTVHWIRPDRRTVVMVDERTLTHVDLDDAYAIDWDITLTPRVDVVLDRTEFTTWGGYGGLALRGRADWTDTRLLLPDGTAHERLLGTTADWLDLSGTVEGSEAGVLLLDHPHNPRHPVPWYASTKSATYGHDGWSNFVNAAFLWDRALTWPAGRSLAFRFRIVAHDGIWDKDRCAKEWARFTTPKPKLKPAPKPKPGPASTPRQRPASEWAGRDQEGD